MEAFNKATARIDIDELEQEENNFHDAAHIIATLSNQLQAAAICLIAMRVNHDKIEKLIRDTLPEQTYENAVRQTKIQFEVLNALFGMPDEADNIIPFYSDDELKDMERKKLWPISLLPVIYHDCDLDVDGSIPYTTRHITDVTTDITQWHADLLMDTVEVFERKAKPFIDVVFSQIASHIGWPADTEIDPVAVYDAIIRAKNAGTYLSDDLRIWFPGSYLESIEEAFEDPAYKTVFLPPRLIN